MHYEAKRLIAANADKIWPVLTDPKRLSDGTFGILKIDGEIAEGRKIMLWSEVDPKRSFKITVDRLDAPREMVWSSGMPLGLFRGSRRFRLTKVSGGTEFHVREDYTGPMAGMIFKHIPDLTASMEQFAAGLAAAVEGEAV